MLKPGILQLTVVSITVRLVSKICNGRTLCRGQQWAAKKALRRIKNCKQMGSGLTVMFAI